MSPETRKYVASALMVCLLLGLLFALTKVEIPSANRDIIVGIVGVLTGASSLALPNLFGDRDAEKDRLRSELTEIRAQFNSLKTEHEVLKQQYDAIVRMLIERHVVNAEGIEVAPRDSGDSARPFAG